MIADLGEEIAAHPARESLHALQMLALHRTVRTAEALAHYAGVRRMLAEEFGADPGPEMAALHQRLLCGGEPGRKVGQPTPPPIAPPPIAPPPIGAVPNGPERDRSPARAAHALPFDVPDFTGRLTDLQRLTAAAAHPGIIAIDGMPGVGKTALAVHLANELARKYPEARCSSTWRRTPRRRPHSTPPGPPECCSA